MASASFEGLGSFYLGKAYDLAARRREDALVLYDARDLVTHAVCVGMTGSGKTGLCTVLLEEAALDGVPALVIDPKGDLANLLLTFPALRPEDFAPWIDPEEAGRAGVSRERRAEQVAERWRAGLAEWGQGGERIARLRAAADFALYTPGSTAVRPLSILASFAAPPHALSGDVELLRERAATAATGLLTLLGLEADPLQSREHILLATLLEQAWRAGRDVDLGGLIGGVQSPPIDKVGVLDLESFYPAKERFELAQRLNNLLASPGFATWLEGEPLDVDALLQTPEGKPRVSILSIAHLPDAERMFFVSLLLGEVLAWMRRQPGTGSLRAILYMDEIAGYVPPVANPPSKGPLLTLMKQARAFGLGVVLATQNPVDLDYKGLSNAGTWLIGRLQTERDRARLLDGLAGAAGGALDRAALERALAQLDARVFLMNNVHEDAPVVFETRWAMSYLRGPLTRAQLRDLAGASAATPTRASPPAAPTPPSAEPGDAAAVERPVLPPDVAQAFLPVRVAPGPGETLDYRPGVLGLARVHFSDPKRGLRADREVARLVEVGGAAAAVDWSASGALTLSAADLAALPAAGARFAALPPECARARSYAGWERQLADHLYRTCELVLLRSAALELVSEPGEREGAFRARLALAAREARDREVDELRARFAPRLARLDERLRRARQAVEVQEGQARSAKASTFLSFGSALLGALTGRKVASVGNVRRAASAARGLSRSSKETADVGRAEDNLAALERQRAELEAEFEAAAAAVATRIDPTSERLAELRLAPRKRDCVVRAVQLVWLPHRVDAQGRATPAWSRTPSPEESS